MESSRPPQQHTETKLITFMLNVYLDIRQWLWSSPMWQLRKIFYQDDAKIKTTDCKNLNTEFHHLNRFEIYRHYFIYFDKQDASQQKQKITDFVEKATCKNAFLFIIGDKSGLFRMTVENGLLKEEDEKISFKNIQFKPFIHKLVGNDPQKNAWLELSKEQVNSLVENTNHNQTKQLKIFIKMLIKLGEASLEKSFFSDTRHGIRTFLINQMNESTLVKEFNHYIEMKETIVKALKKEISLLSNKISEMKATAQDDKAKAEVLKEEELLRKNTEVYHKKLRKLAHLGNAWAIIEAINEKQLPSVSFPKDINFNFSLSLAKTFKPFLPLEYHPNYYLCLHEMNCNTLKQIKESKFKDCIVSFDLLLDKSLSTEIIPPKVESYAWQAAAEMISTVIPVNTTNLVYSACNNVRTLFNRWYYSTPSTPTITEEVEKDFIPVNTYDSQ